MKQIDFFQVDAFTNRAFGGNPAAVCFVEPGFDETLMQRIAAENNLAETAFVEKKVEGFNLRWFTPTVEVDLCGHATLAAAHVLWQAGVLGEDQAAEFTTRSGLLKAEKKGDWIELDLPTATLTDVDLPKEIVKALNISPVNVVFAKDRYLIEVGSAREVESIAPDFLSLREFDMIVVTAKADPQSPFDFVSRTFGPSVGIDEDPVTGSSHCGLVPYWSAKLGKGSLFAFQASKRGGELKLQSAGERVLIAGQAVTVIKGVFYP